MASIMPQGASRCPQTAHKSIQTESTPKLTKKIIIAILLANVHLFCPMSTTSSLSSEDSARSVSHHTVSGLFHLEQVTVAVHKGQLQFARAARHCHIEHDMCAMLVECSIESDSVRTLYRSYRRIRFELSTSTTAMQSFAADALSALDRFGDWTGSGTPCARYSPVRPRC